MKELDINIDFHAQVNGEINFGLFCSMLAVILARYEDLKLSYKFKLFKQMDKDGSGRLTTSEIAAFLNQELNYGVTL